MANYKAVWKDTTPIKSERKGTPGLEILVQLTYIQRGDDWEPITETMERRIWLYFPVNGNSEVSINKLRSAGWTGQDLRSVEQLHGKTIDVYSVDEVYEGRTREKFDISTGHKKESEYSDDAFRAIDAILQSAPRATTVTPASQPAAAPQPDTYAQHVDAEENQPAAHLDRDIPF